MPDTSDSPDSQPTPLSASVLGGGTRSIPCAYHEPAQLQPGEPCAVFGLDGSGMPIADLYIGHPATGQPVLVGMRRVLRPDPSAPDPFAGLSDAAGQTGA
jgi:hypothetical protein